MPELATLDPVTFAPPKSRIGDGSQASQFTFRLIDADNLRAQQRVKVKGIYDGNAPCSRAELKAKGLGANCNLNWRQAAAVINQFKTPYYDLVVEVPYLADIQTALGNSVERAEWSQTITEEFDRMVKGWGNWDFVVQFHQFQMLLHGVGICYFHDKTDWRPDVCQTGEVLVPDGTRSNLDEVEIICILKNYASHNLYRYIRNPEQAARLGWNIHATEKAIVESYSGTGQPPTDTNAYEWYQQKLRNADLYYGTYESRDVYCAHQLVREFDDRVSHHLVRADRVTSDFLYTNVGRFDSMEDVICPFFYDIGDGTWHSIRGLGYEIYPYCEAFNRLRNREVDGAMIASTVLLQQESGDQATKAQLITLTNLGILPPGLKVQSTNIGQGIEATVSVRRDMETGLNNNIGLLQSAPGPQPRQGQKAKILEMQQKASLNKGNINRYYTSFDKLYQQMFKRAANPGLRAFHPGAKSALDFQRRCVARGVPIQALQEIDSVHAMRSIGAGSAVNAIQVTEAIMEHAASLPEDGRKLAIRDWISRLAGGKFADRYMGDLNKDRENTQDDSIAQLENDAMRNGGKVIITKDQSHIIHLESHIGDSEQHIAEVQEATAKSGQQDLAGLQHLLIHLDAAGKHCLDHLKQLKDDKIREGDFKTLYKRWQQLAKIQDQVKQQIEEMLQQQAREQESQQQQPGADTTDILKLINYKTAPESVKQQIEQAVGITRQEGDLSEAAHNLQIKEQNLALKAQKDKRQGAAADIKLAHEIKTDE